MFDRHFRPRYNNEAETLSVSRMRFFHNAAKGFELMEHKRKSTGLLLKIIGGAVSVILLAAVSFSLILAQPQSDAEPKAEQRQLPAASEPQEIRNESEFRSIVESFPIPVMSFLSGSGMTFVSGRSESFQHQDGYGRIATLYWQTSDAVPLILQSIFPSDALRQLSGNYHFVQTAGPMLFGSSSVRMEDSDTVRIHASNDYGLYVVIVPKSLSNQISSLCRSLQLFSVREQSSQ